MSELQSGILAFLFTDIEGSTRLWDANPDAMSAALERHDALLHNLIAANGGRVFKTAGDAFCAVFAHPAPAIAAAVACQRALVQAASQLPVLLRVRMAVHAGHAESRDGDYFGPPLNRVARLLATAHGEQILVSRAAAELARGELAAEIALRDLGAYALKDLQQQERIFQVVASGLAAQFPALRTPERLLQRVPRPTTPLIGRDAEVATARAALGRSSPGDAASPSAANGVDRAARLLTLTGPGGAGKTRLALHLALDLGVEFGDGAVFVSLAALSDPALVPVAIAAALEPGETSGESPRDIVINQLRDRHLLLILDNFEQVMEAAELASDLLRHCPRLTILATSRERLNLMGEHELAVPPLSLPERPARDTTGNLTRAIERPVVETIRRSPAVQLFLERARTVKPGFEITPDNAETVAEICTRLDGLPLAIELAAARVRLLAPRALLDRFDHRLDVLSRGRRDLPARQQTMRDTIAWSYELLDPAEQRLFAALAVFVGGATLEAASTIAGDPQGVKMAFSELELLESLADKSLLKITDDDEPRVLMLETIRDFALERLEASEARNAVRARHAAYFLAIAEAAEPLLKGQEQAALLARLDREQANLRAAIAWLRDGEQTEQALRLAGALWRYWWLRGDMGDGRSTLESLLQGAAIVAPEVRAKALNGAGVLAESQGDWALASHLHQESLAISRDVNDLHGVAWSLNNLGVVQINQGNYEQARILLEESLAVAEVADDAADTATALTDLGMIAHYQGEYERATALLRRSLSLFRALGDESHMARALNNLGTVALERGALDEAHDLLTESLGLHRGVGDRQGIASTLNNLAEVVSARGDAFTAQRLYLESHTLALEGGNRLCAAIAMENLARLAHHQGDVHLARTRFQEALALYCAAGDQQGIVTCLAGLAAVAAQVGHAREAAVLLGAVSGICQRHEQLPIPDSDDDVRALRAQLGPEAFKLAWQTGRALDEREAAERASADALSWTGSATA